MTNEIIKTRPLGRPRTRWPRYSRRRGKRRRTRHTYNRVQDGEDFSVFLNGPASCKSREKKVTESTFLFVLVNTKNYWQLQLQLNNFYCATAGLQVNNLVRLVRSLLIQYVSVSFDQKPFKSILCGMYNNISTADFKRWHKIRMYIAVVRSKSGSV